MAYTGRLHSGLCHAWLFQTLCESSLSAAYGDRFYPLSAKPKRELVYPHIYWTGGKTFERQFEGRPTKIQSSTSNFDVRCVRRFGTGGGDESFFDEDLHQLRNVLTGVGFTEVFVESEKIGTIYQARYVRDYGIDFDEGDVLVMERGISIEILHK